MDNIALSQEEFNALNTLSREVLRHAPPLTSLLYLAAALLAKFAHKHSYLIYVMFFAASLLTGDPHSAATISSPSTPAGFRSTVTPQPPHPSRPRTQLHRKAAPLARSCGSPARAAPRPPPPHVGPNRRHWPPFEKDANRLHESPQRPSNPSHSVP